MRMRPLGHSGLQTAPLVFGGNVFGWTVDAATSFKLLDAFVDSGFNAIDTADAYSRWVPGHQGGESETVIGDWLQARPGRRERVLLLTKVGSDMGAGRKGLSARWIEQAVEDSLRRLRTDHIDVYQAHWPDPQTPIDETLRAFESLLKAGKVRAIGTSNVSAAQLEHDLRLAGAQGLPRYSVLQPEYNLVERAGFEDGLRDVALREGLGVITYYSLASGFLSGKYRSAADAGQSPRGAGVAARYLNPRGLRILDALDAVAARHAVHAAEIALAWLIGRPGVTAPIASATSLQQLAGLTRAARLVLTPADVAELDAASA
jgi:aryl-alcohol dehydrogenase-like predicted oxidoreductase